MCCPYNLGQFTLSHVLYFYLIKETGQKEEYCKRQFEKYICKDYSRFH